MKRNILTIIFLTLSLSNFVFADFVKSGNIVSDNISKLQWQDDTAAKTTTKIWSEAITYCENLSLNSYDDWRLPNKKELLSIIDYSRHNPSINNAFEHTYSSYYWSSTTYASHTDYAWYGYFGSGYSNFTNKSRNYNVRCVRAGQFENFELKNIGLLGETPKDYEIKTSSFTKSWTFSEDISNFFIEIIDSSYDNSISSSSFIISGDTLSVSLTPNFFQSTNKLSLKLKDSNEQTVKINGSDTFWSITKTNNAPRLADGQITQLISASNEGAFLEIETYDPDAYDNVTLTIEDTDGGYVGFDPENPKKLFASFSDGKSIHTIKVGLSDGREKVIKEFNVLQFNSISIENFYSDVDVNNPFFKDIAFGTFEGVFAGQADPNDGTKRIFRPDDEASMAETLAMILQATKKVGKIELLTSEYYLNAYPSWAMPYYTYAKKIGAIDDIGDDLSVVYPKKEEIARIIVKALNLDEYPDLYTNIDYTYDNEDKFTNDDYKKYADITNLFGLMFTNSYEDPSLKLSRAEVASIVSKIFMMPKATIVSPEEVNYGENFDITIENIEAENINSSYQLENTFDIEKSYAIDKTILSSNPINSLDLNVGKNQILAVLNNNGVKNIVRSEVRVNFSQTYSWKIGDWEACTNTCGMTNSIQLREVSCQTSTEIPLEDSYCSEISKPITSRTCQEECINNNPITYSWQTQDWGICQGECGTNNAIQTRIVQCKSSNDYITSSNMCSETKPSTSQMCTASQCQTTMTLSEQFIERFYQNILNRTADTGGMATWLNTIQNESAAKVALGFFKSTEFTNLGLSNEEFVDILYQTLFDREADSGGREGWLNQLNTGTSKDEVMYGFFNAQEFTNLANTFGVTPIRDEDQLNPYGTTGVDGYVNRFYTLVLNRTPDEDGFNDWTTQLNNRTKAGGDIAKGFFFSPEYTNRNLDNSTFLDICYRAFFDREADAGGKANWTTLLDQGGTKDEVLNGFIGSVEFAALAASFGIEAGTVVSEWDIVNSSVEQYMVYGGYIPFSGDIGNMINYTLLGKTSGISVFSGDYDYYAIVNQGNTTVKIDSVKASNNQYYGTGVTSNTGDSWMNLSGAPDGNYTTIAHHGYILIDVSYGDINKIKIFGEE